MKTCFMILATLFFMQIAHADSAVNIKINLTPSLVNNKLFLCIPSIGCLSIRAAQQGKVYPIFRGFKMPAMYVTNMKDFRVHRQIMPDSCSVQVEPSQTLTISGHMTVIGKDRIFINQLRCAVR